MTPTHFNGPDNADENTLWCMQLLLDSTCYKIHKDDTSFKKDLY